MVNKQSRSEVRVKKHNRMRNRFAGTAATRETASGSVQK